MKLARLTDVRFQTALQKLSVQPVPLRVAFKLKGISTKVQEEIKKFEEVRVAALEKLGNKGEDGKVLTKPDGSVELSNENLQAFAKELNELSQTDLEMPTLKLDELGDKVQLTADDLMLLDGLVVE